MELGSTPPSPALSLADFDRAVFKSLGIDQDDPPDLVALVQLYLELSGRHHDRPHEATGALLETSPLSALESLVRLIIFSRRSFFAVRTLETLLPNLPVVEHGAGYAPALLALHPRPAHAAVEHFHHYRALRRSLFEALQINPPTGPTRWTPDEATNPKLHVFAHALFEMADGQPETALKVVTQAIRPQDTCLILEPGDQTHAHFLQALRDAWVDTCPSHSIAAPCPPRRECSLKPNPRDWCHFRFPYEPHPLGERILASARREAHRINFSFLLLVPNAPSPDPSPHRLLGHRIQAKQKVLGDLCTSDGPQTVVALRRTRETYDKLLSIPPGAALTISLADLVLRGDGHRLREPKDLSVRWSPTPPTGTS